MCARVVGRRFEPGWISSLTADSGHAVPCPGCEERVFTIFVDKATGAFNGWAAGMDRPISPEAGNGGLSGSASGTDRQYIVKAIALRGAGGNFEVAPMSDGKQLIFCIEAYSPETIPMAKLAEYMADFAALLGKENAVHFVGLRPGSTNLAARVEFEDLPKVTTRLDDLRRGNPSKDAAKAFDQIDARLANDNASGRILIEGDDGATSTELLTFPGRDRPKARTYGPFTQEGTLDGLLISVGGKDETISLRLQNGEAIYSKCETNRPLARELGRHLFEPIRIHGTGRWMRETDGTWSLMHFRVHRFDVLAKDSLREAVTALRAVHGSEWRGMPDPVAELGDLRNQKDELH